MIIVLQKTMLSRDSEIIVVSRNTKVFGFLVVFRR